MCRDVVAGGCHVFEMQGCNGERVGVMYHYLQVEHAGLLGLLECRVLGTLLEKTVKLSSCQRMLSTPFESHWAARTYLEELVI